MKHSDPGMFFSDGRTKPDYSWFRIIVITAAALGVIHAGMGFFRDSQTVLAEIPLFVPMIHGFAALAAFCIAFMALGRQKVSRDPVSLWIGIAFASFCIISMLYIFTWPGMRRDGLAIFGRQPGTPAWIISQGLFFLGGLLLAADLAAVPARREYLYQVRTVSVWLALTILFGILLVAFEDHLPILIGPGGTFTALLVVFHGLILIFFTLGALLSVRRYLQTGNSLYAYLAVVQVAMAFSVIGTTMGGKRYAVMWYLCRLLTVAGFLFMLFALLWEYVRMYWHESEKTSQLEASIAERRLAEAALRESEEKYRIIFETANEGIWITDADRKTILVNQKMADLLGFTMEEILGRIPAEFLDAGQENITLKTREKLLTGANTRQEFRFRRKDGSDLWIISSASPVLDAEGRFGGTISMLTDITIRKKAEEDLQESRSRLEAVFAAIPDMVAEYDAGGRLIRSNEAAIKTAGLGSPGLTNEKVIQSLHTRHLDGSPVNIEEAPTSRALRGEIVKDEQYLISTIDGRELVVETYAAPLYKDGRVSGAVALWHDITELKRTEDELRESEKQAHWLGRLPEENPNPILRVAADGAVLYRNPSAFSNPGWRCETGRSLPHEKLRRLLHEAITGDRITEEEVELGGTCFSIAVVPFRQESYANFYGRDISERKKAEEAMLAKDAELQLVADTTPVVLTRLSSDLRYVFVNRACVELFGKAREEIIGKYIVDIMGKEAFGTIRPYIDRVLRGEMVDYETEIPYKGTTGSRFMRVHYVPERNPQGDIVGWIASVLDITGRKQAEEALRESEAKYRNLFENMAEEVHFWRIVRREDGRVRTWRLVDANPPTLRTWGRNSLEEIREKTTDDIFGPGATDHYLPVVQKIMDEGTPLSYEDYFPNLNKYFRFTSVPLGEYFITTGADITSIKQAQEMLRKTAEDLERSNKDLEQFAYVASHDLQEPLRAINGFLKLLQERYGPKMDEKAREFIGYTVEGATRMSGLITDLLEYSRVERQGKEFRLTVTGDALVSALSNLRGSIQEAGAEVTHDPLPNVNADPGQLVQLFQNLIGNAIKFRSPDRPCRVHIGTVWEDDGIFFTVRDNGIGIALEQYERIFVIFQRLHTRDKYTGTGIGLAICKKIVERHGGKIRVESKVGEGSTFSFMLSGSSG